MTDPMPDEKQQLHDRIVTFFFHHVVALRAWATLPDGKRWSAVYTCFVLDVAGHWYLITAGHILQDLYATLPKCTDVRCDLFDGWDDQHRLATPFNVLDAKHLHFDEHWLDIGIIRLEPLHRRNLERAGIRAFDEIGWRNPPTDMLAYAVIGLPDQLGNQPTIVLVKGVPTPPELDRLFPRFCGKLPDSLVHKPTGASLTEMVGLSGGPIIGFTKPQANGEVRYFLIAAQSAWLREQRLLVGPLMEAVAHGIREAFSNESDGAGSAT